MRIPEVTIGSTDIQALERFHRDVLDLPVARTGDTAIDVTVGTGTVRYRQRSGFAGAHHLAFSIAPEDFDHAHDYLAERIDLLQAGGSHVIDGPEGWTSRSVYFTAPDGLILEYIAHEGHRGRGGHGAAPKPFGIAEVGLGVADVPGAIDKLGRRGIPPFPRRSPISPPSVTSTGS